MKRFICYLYEYQEGKRVKNIGFSKVESTEQECIVSIHGRGWGVKSPTELSLYLFYREGEHCYGIYQGKLTNISPALNYRLVYHEEDTGGRECFDKIEGFILCQDEMPRYASVWTDEAIDISQMEPVSGNLLKEETKEEEPKEKEVQVTEEPEEQKAEEVSEEEPVGKIFDVTELKPEEDKQEETVDEPEICEQECASTCPFQCTKIKRQEISRLVRREWHLANNSFLLHGYYNYHHLAFIEDGNTLFLGVPGIWCEREERAAQAFGFPRFIKFENDMLELVDGEKDLCSDFGYWCRQVHQIRV